MSTDMIPADTRTELVRESASATTFLEALDAIAVANQADLDFVGELLVNTKERFKALEDRRTRITKPILAAKREVDALFCPVLDPLKAAEKILKDKIAAYTIARDAERMAALPAVASGDVAPLALVPAEMPKGVSMRTQWSYEVTDADALPRQFLTVDHEALKRHCALADTETPPLFVAGIKFVKTGSVVVRT